LAIVGILGAGMMGSAMALPLADRGHAVHLVGTHLDGAVVRELQSGRAHPGLNVVLPASVRAFAHTELRAALAGVELFVLGVSSVGVRWAGRELAPLLSERPRPILMVSKGLETRAGELVILPDALHEELVAQGVTAPAPVGVAGPCIAGVLARRVQTCVLFTSREPEVARTCAEWLSGPYYQPQVALDVVGVEVCTALKNAYALGVGFGAGVHERAGGQPGSVAMHNYEAAVFAQAIIEMQRIIVRLGSSAETAAGLAGAGDLTVTCNGGRTGRFGKLLGSGLSLSEAIAGMRGATLESLEILRVMAGYLAQGARLERAELPLLAHLIEVALCGKPVAVPFGSFFR
jgi:glycerol-3-phosphate dehydrogenase (NAD(P)+)